VAAAAPRSALLDGGYPCPAGFYCPQGSSAPLACPAGTFQEKDQMLS
jgi:hypothetical protein